MQFIEFHAGTPPAKHELVASIKHRHVSPTGKWATFGSPVIGTLWGGFIFMMQMLSQPAVTRTTRIMPLHIVIQALW